MLFVSRETWRAWVVVTCTFFDVVGCVALFLCACRAHLLFCDLTRGLWCHQSDGVELESRKYLQHRRATGYSSDDTDSFGHSPVDPFASEFSDHGSYGSSDDEVDGGGFRFAEVSLPAVDDDFAPRWP